MSDRKAAALKARRLAVENARDKAVVLAEQTGLKLGDAIQIIDDSTDHVGALRRPAHDVPDSDPFGANLERARDLHISADERLIAFRAAHGEKFDVDSLPPAEITVAATVRIVSAVAKP